MYGLYRSLTYIISPLVPLLLKKRLAQGKEERARINERLGQASVPRPAGKLVWIHAASVGEANAVLPLIAAILEFSPHMHVVITTVTVTSARLLANKLPENAVHQFAPVDTPQAVRAFLSHWKPDVALWVDSEIWPNLIMATHAQGAILGAINARLSARSAKRWHYAGGFARHLFSCFTWCFAQSMQDAKRLRALGMKNIQTVGNLKYDALPLACDEAELARLQTEVGSRPLWLASSTHPGEEALIAQVHKQLKGQFPTLLTLIVPRHSRRGSAIASELQEVHIALRSQGDIITPETGIYLADTMGELGLFYRLAQLVFMGGTLVSHGGQNPLEAARLGAAIIVGPHMENFADMCEALKQENACIQVRNVAELAQAVTELLQNNAKRAALSQNANSHIAAHSGALYAIMNELQPILG